MLEALQKMPSANSPSIANENCAVLVFQLNDGFNDKMKWVGFSKEATQKFT